MAHNNIYKLKHCYVIIAHHDKSCLQTLISLIDDKRNDIIIIRDKKSNPDLILDLPIHHSRLITPPDNQLIDIRWGDISQIKAELLGFKTAINSGKYSYIHLLSGVDLPIKNQDYIHKYFLDLPQGTNLINISECPQDILAAHTSVCYFHLFTKEYKNPNLAISKLYSYIRSFALELQRRFKFKRLWKGYTIRKGHNWVSITDDFAKYLVNNESKILKLFRHTKCADEIYKQTLCLSSSFASTLYVDKKYIGAKRHIDWKRGKPYTFTRDDFNELISSDGLFARKFSSATDNQIISMISNYITDKDTR